MTTLRDSWHAFERATITRFETRAPAFQPLDASVVAALRESFDVAGEIVDVLFARYPADGVRLPWCDGRPCDHESSMIVPSVAWLLALRVDDPPWPRAWFPVAVTGDHLVQFTRADTPGVFAVHNDDCGGDYAGMNPERAYASLAAFVQAATVTVTYLRAEAFHEERRGKWPLRARVPVLDASVRERVLRESCPAEDGPALLPQTGVALD